MSNNTGPLPRVEEYTPAGLRGDLRGRKSPEGNKIH